MVLALPSGVVGVRRSGRQVGELRSAATPDACASHHRINKRVTEVREDMQQIGSAAELQQVVEDFKKLRDELSANFREEEEGAVLEEAVSHNPAIAAEADRLKEQHKELLNSLRAICAKAELASLASEAIKEMVGEFDSFAATLHAHETAENRIMEQGFNLDLGLENT